MIYFSGSVERAERHAALRLERVAEANSDIRDRDADNSEFVSWGMGDDAVQDDDELMGTEPERGDNAGGFRAIGAQATEELPEYLRVLSEGHDAPQSLHRLGLPTDERKLKPADRKSWAKIQKADAKLANLRLEIKRIQGNAAKSCGAFFRFIT